MPVHAAPVTFNEPISLQYAPVEQPSTGDEIVRVRWYLGLKGIVLPGKGLGIEAVEADSPADTAGLKSGMVVTHCNDVQIVDDAKLSEAIASSDGLLKLRLLESADAEPVESTVQMKKLTTVSL